jgi:phage terminase small subunit
MPALKNPRHEKFALALLEGRTADEAYQLAGYRPNRGNAIRLKANERIQTRLRELQAQAEQQAVLDRAWVLRRLKESVEIALQEGAHRDRLDKPDLAAAVRHLELLGKELGMFRPPAESPLRRIYLDLSKLSLEALTGLQKRVEEEGGEAAVLQQIAQTALEYGEEMGPSGDQADAERRFG